MKKRQKIRLFMVFLLFLLFPVVLNYLSPYLIIDGAQAGIITGSFIVFIGLFVSALIFGRTWCGWVCPAAGMQDLGCSFIAKKADGKIGKYVKYVIWVVWIALITLLFISAGGIIGINFLHKSESIVSVTNIQNYVIYYGVLFIIFILNLIFGRRAFCRYACWMAPFMVIGRHVSNFLRIPSLRLTSDKSNCVTCAKCTTACPMSIDVMENVQKQSMENSECVLCLNCVDTCPNGCIKTAFRPYKKF